MAIELKNKDMALIPHVWLSGVSFWGSLGFAQIVGGKIFGLSCASVPWSSIAGAAVVAASVVGHVEATRYVFGDKYRIETRVEYASYIIGGLGLFNVFGGKFSSVFPSDVLRPGAFAALPLPATENYADQTEREHINSVGSKYGCHSCGSKEASKYHADHQPPLKIARIQRSYIFEKFFGTTEQVFYSQCNDCSNVQANAARLSTPEKTMKVLIYHFKQYRMYHSVGFIQGLFLYLQSEKRYQEEHDHDE